MPIGGSATLETTPPPPVTRGGLNGSPQPTHTQTLPISSPTLSYPSELDHASASATASHEVIHSEHEATNETHTEPSLNDENAVGGMAFPDFPQAHPTPLPLSPTPTTATPHAASDFFGGIQGHGVVPAIHDPDVVEEAAPVGIAGLVSQTALAMPMTTVEMQRTTHANGEVATIVPNAVVSLEIPTASGARVTLLTTDSAGVLQAIIYTYGAPSLVPAETLKNGRADALITATTTRPSDLFSSLSSTSTSPSAAETSKRPKSDPVPNIVGFSVLGGFFVIGLLSYAAHLVWKRYKARKDHLAALGLEQGAHAGWNDEVFDPKAEWFGARRPEFEDDSSLAGNASSQRAPTRFGGRREFAALTPGTLPEPFSTHFVHH